MRIKYKIPLLIKHTMENNEENKALEAQQKEVEVLINTAKQDIADLKSSANNAKQIIALIEAYGIKLEEFKTLVENPESGLIANHTTSKLQKESIEALKISAEEYLGQIKSNLGAVLANIQQMNEAYEKFTDLNTKINSPESGLNWLLEKATQLKTEIETVRQNSDNLLTEIKNDLSTVQANIQQMNEAYLSFQEIKTKLNDPEVGIAKIHENSEIIRQEIIALKKQSEAVFQEIKKYNSESQIYTKEIADFKTISEDTKNTILDIEGESRNLRDKIEKIYKIATDSGLANSFDVRKRDLKKSSTRWLLGLIASVVTLTAVLSFLLVPILKDGATIDIDQYTWFRLTLTSPLIFFVSFASVQYSKDRSLLEKYAFKAATALSLEAYSTLLINTFGKEKEGNEREILSFVLTSMATIYQEPYEKIDSSKFNFGIDAKITKVAEDFTEKLDETKREILNLVKERV